MADNEISSLEEKKTARSFRNIHNLLRRKIEEQISPKNAAKDAWPKTNLGLG